MTDGQLAIFHVQTPYQALQALAIAAGSSARSVLLAVPTHPSQALLLDSIASLEDGPLAQVVRLDAVDRRFARLPGSLARRLSAAANVRRIAHLTTESCDALRVFTGNAQTVEGQALVAAAKRQPGANAFVTEDGLLTYEKRYRAPDRTSRLAGLVRRVYLGDGGRRPAGALPYDLLDGLYVSFPDAIDRREWPGVEPVAIPDPTAIGDALGRLAEANVPPSEIERTRELDALVVLPHASLLAGPDDRRVLAELVGVLVGQGLTVGLKYHPREPRPYLELDDERARVMRPELAVELLFLVAGDRLRWIVTDRTTAALSGPRYCRGARTVVMGSRASPVQQDAIERLCAVTGAALAASPSDALEVVTRR